MVSLSTDEHKVDKLPTIQHFIHKGLRPFTTSGYYNRRRDRREIFGSVVQRQISANSGYVLSTVFVYTF